MLRTSAVLVVALVAGSCARQEIPASERAEATEAEGLANRGDWKAASDAWKSLRDSAQDRRSVARAELELAKIETTLEARDLALRRLDALAARVASGGSADADDVRATANEIVAPFLGTPFGAELSERRDRALAAVSPPNTPGTADDATLRDRIKNGQFSAALNDLAASLDERTRTPERAAELRSQVEAAADVAARALVDQARSSRRREDAIDTLKAAMPRFRGTPSHALLALELDAARAALAPPGSDASPSSEHRDH